MYRVTARFEFEERSLLEMYSDEYVLISPVITEKAGKAGSFKFDIPFLHPEYQSVIPFRTYVTVYKDGEEYWHGRVVNAEEDFYRTKSITCEGDLAFLNDSILPPYQFSGDIPEYIDYILGLHNAQVEEEKRIRLGTVSVTDLNGYLSRGSQNYPNALAELTDKLLNTYGGYFRTRREGGVTYLDYVYEYGAPNSQELRIEENILDYTCKLGSDFCTRLIPLGAKPENTSEENPQRLTIESVNGGRNYVDNAELVARYGVIVGTNTWDNVADPVNLKLKGQSYVNSQEVPKSIELTAVDLSNINVDIKTLRVGCMTTVISPFHELNTAYFMAEKVTNLDSPESDYVTLGEENSTYTGKTYKRQQAAENQLSKVEQEARESIVDVGKTITGTKGGYVVLDTFDDSGKLVDPWQLLIMDRPDKTHAVNIIRMNQGGIAFSTSGYDGPYKSAWDINGQFVADFIQAGTMLADRIRGGTLELGGLGNQNGVLKMLDALGTIIGLWDKDGLRLITDTQNIIFKTTDSRGKNWASIMISEVNEGKHVGAKLIMDRLVFSRDLDADIKADEYTVFDEWGMEKQYMSDTGRKRSASYGTDMSCEYGDFSADVFIGGTLDVSGGKSRVVFTPDYGAVRLAAYETPSPMFGDIGSGQIGDDGQCYISLDPVFLQTVNTGCEYQVFLQAYGLGELFVSAREPAFFIVCGTPGLNFGWEVKAKQRDYEQCRMDNRRDRMTTRDSVDYAADGLQHYKNYTEGLQP